jgi:hypothetical protein
VVDLAVADTLVVTRHGTCVEGAVAGLLHAAELPLGLALGDGRLAPRLDARLLAVLQHDVADDDRDGDQEPDRKVDQQREQQAEGERGDGPADPPLHLGVADHAAVRLGSGAVERALAAFVRTRLVIVLACGGLGGRVPLHRGHCGHSLLDLRQQT